MPGCYSPWSGGSHAGLVIASHYPPQKSSELIGVSKAMGKAETSHTSHPIPLLK